MGIISNTIGLARSSLGVLRQDQELLVLPAVSAVSCAVVGLAFGGAAFLSVEHVANPQPGQNEWNGTPLTWAIGVVGLFAIGMVAQFFAGVLVAGANQRLEGGHPTLGSAFRQASQHTGKILGWAAINSTVGLLLNAIREKAGILGAVASSLLGLAWNVISWLALPMIVIDGVGPIEAVTRSARLLKQTWGENIVAQFGFGIIGMLLMLPGVAIGALLLFAVPLAGIVLLVVWIASVSVFMATLSAIYRTALYRFATGRPAGGDFDEQALAGAFRPKTGVSRLLG